MNPPVHINSMLTFCLETEWGLRIQCGREALANVYKNTSPLPPKITVQRKLKMMVDHKFGILDVY